MPRLALWDVDDAAAFVAAIVTRSGLTLSYHDREDLEQYLLVESWKLSLVYDETLGSFSNYAFVRLRQRTVDWQRQQNGGRTVWKFRDRVHIRELPKFVSLDTDDPDDDRLGAALSRGCLDDDERGLAAELRALQARGRRPGRRDDRLDWEAA